MRYACTHIFACVYLDIWIILQPPNFGEMKIFVLLGLFGHLHDASEQGRVHKVLVVGDLFGFFFFLSKLDRRLCRNLNTLE